ncbi:hypothetical protein ACAD15_002411 [Enterobacter bugandensis]
MTKQYKFEEILSSEMPLSNHGEQIAALQVGLASLIAALEAKDPGFVDRFMTNYDFNFNLNRESTAAPAIAVLGAMIKAAQLTKI